MKTEQFNLVDRAIGGDKQALEELMASIQDMVYNLSLRMLGSPHDAEDASQEIYIRIITGLSTFKKESAFSTWVYRVASNHLLNYKKSMFAKMPPLSFEYYGADIEAGFIESSHDAWGGVDEDILAQELKMSCTNVMLQCFDPESRLIYVLGIMFRADSKICGEILGITPEAYRQRLSRIRQKMAGFLKQYCGGCSKAIGYLCYVTYDQFKFVYQCKCGNHGSIDISFENDSAQTAGQPLITIKNRLCCPADESPLVTILTKNLDAYKLEITCKECNMKYC